MKLIRPFTLISLLISCLSFSLFAQEHKDIKKVKAILQQQASHWNEGNIDAFMEDYWNSEKLQFIGSKGVTYGWQQTKDNYKKRYPDKTAMGFLTFHILDVQRLSRKAIMLTGKFHLERTIGDLEGHFLLVWRKMKESGLLWRIIPVDPGILPVYKNTCDYTGRMPVSTVY